MNDSKKPEVKRHLSNPEDSFKDAEVNDVFGRVVEGIRSENPFSRPLVSDGLRDDYDEGPHLQGNPFLELE